MSDTPRDKKINLPAPISLTSTLMHMMLTNRGDRQKKTLVPKTSFSDVAGVLNDKHPYQKIEDGFPFLEVWQEYEKLSDKDMSDRLGIAEKDYLDIKSGDCFLPFGGLKDICRSLRLHPIEIYNPNAPTGDAQHDEMITLLCDAYKNPTHYVMPGGEMHECLIDALVDAADRGRSYNILANYFDEIRYMHPDHPLSCVAKILGKLLINDGNPYFSDYMSPSEFIESEKAKILDEHTGKVAQMDLIELWAQKTHRDLFISGYHLFEMNADSLITDWMSYEMTDTSDSEFDYLIRRDAWCYTSAAADEDDLERFLSLLATYGQRAKDIAQLSAEIDGFGSQIIAIENFMDGYKKSPEILIEQKSKRVFAVDFFVEGFGDAVRAYDIRQRIMSVIGQKYIEPLGAMESSNTLSVPKENYCKEIIKRGPSPV